MPRVNTVVKSRKPKTCSHCRSLIPIGSSYRWMKPRYGRKQIRCTKSECAFKPTDLSSSKTARIEEAIDEARDAVSVAVSHEDIENALQQVADVARDKRYLEQLV